LQKGVPAGECDLAQLREPSQEAYCRHTAERTDEFVKYHRIEPHCPEEKGLIEQMRTLREELDRDALSNLLEAEKAFAGQCSKTDRILKEQTFRLHRGRASLGGGPAPFKALERPHEL